MANMWQIIITEFDRKGHMVQVNLCCWMMEKHVSETDDIHAHLDDMALSYEHLSSMGATIHDEDYASMILMSLPDSYMTYLETLSDMAIGSGHTFTTHNIISKATKLTDKQQLWASHDPKLNQKSSAFQASESCSKGKRGTSSKGTLSASTVVRRGIMPVTAMVPEEPRRDSNPLKDGHLKAMTMPPTLLQLCRMVPGQKSHSDPFKSSPWTLPHHLLVKRPISTLKKYPRYLMAHLPQNQ